MFDRERTLLEGLTRPTSAAERWAGELLREHRHTVDRARPRRYAKHLGVREQLARVLPRATPRAHAQATGAS